jgi:hypothetical protein
MPAPAALPGARDRGGKCWPRGPEGAGRPLHEDLQSPAREPGKPRLPSRLREAVRVEAPVREGEGVGLVRTGR